MAMRKLPPNTYQIFRPKQPLARRQLVSLFHFLRRPPSGAAFFYRGRSMDPIVKGGQGRTDEEVEALSESSCNLAVFGLLTIVAWFVWLALSS